jgi:hypothetical protein
LVWTWRGCAELGAGLEPPELPELALLAPPPEPEEVVLVVVVELELLDAA